MVDFSNLNSLAASILVETWGQLGLTQAVVCPGSRSSPLTVAFARQGGIECLVSLDERSAAFFALGHAKRTRQPVALVCTSGTAAANFFPAIIEAHYSQVPLLVLTGDRPPMLRQCHAGQTIDQTKLYGNYPQWQTELALPEPTLDFCHYLRQTAIQAWQRCCWPHFGVVHLNCPFGEPLAPTPDNSVSHLMSQLDLQRFYQHLQNSKKTNPFPTINPSIAD
ncbi:MAG: 2-succinyl-6-hydroxy-2,4-cyclohexadiene-carboxylate synthase, partial [Cyanobacteriota bacterium]